MAIVIVVDSPTNLFVLKQLACIDRAPVPTFVRALEALRYLKGHAAELVIVDCGMPELNGIDLVIALRRLAQHRQTPVLMITQHATAEFGEKAMHAAVDEVVHRGIGSQDIRAKKSNDSRGGERGGADSQRS